jgi:cellulose synthase/poly-beta-1,6-N-acetylglucosamine synthase-like glycosyltransferase
MAAGTTAPMASISAAPIRAVPAAPARQAGAHRKGSGRRSGVLYVIIVAAWAALLYALAGAVRPVAEAAFRRDVPLGVGVVFTGVFIAYFWLNGLKDIAYPIAYRLMRHPLPPSRPLGEALPLVGLLYATCNDFSAESLDRCLRQDYPNCVAVILDDSSKPGYLAQVDEYARRNGITVVRRADRAGFKAGNLNNYLRGAGRELDYFVIIDSDEILPPGFVTRALDYFADSPATGIVQANHIATRNRTTFMRMFAPGVDAHWPAYQAVKSRCGFMSLLGHGAMVSRAAYEAAGGFPHVVAEDIGFAIDARRAGYRTVFAPDITCEEEFPPDYAAFKKRHRKWTEGNMEFIRRYSGRILFSRGLSWYEKLDIVLFTYSLPLTGIFSLYVAANAIVFPLLHFRYHYPLWMLIPTVAFLLAPMMNDALTWIRQPKARLTSYLLHSVALFGSVYFVSLFASLRTMFGRSVFHVTPKTARGASLRAAIRQNAAELIAGTVLAAAVAGASGSVLPVILLLIPVTFGIYLSVMNAGDAVCGPRDGKHILQERK